MRLLHYLHNIIQNHNNVYLANSNEIKVASTNINYRIKLNITKSTLQFLKFSNSSVYDHPQRYFRKTSYNHSVIIFLSCPVLVFHFIHFFFLPTFLSALVHISIFVGDNMIVLKIFNIKYFQSPHMLFSQNSNQFFQ